MDTKTKERRLKLADKLAKLSPADRARVLKLAKIKRLKRAIEQELAARATDSLPDEVSARVAALNEKAAKRPQDTEGQTGEVIDHDDVSTTLRTYPAGGDPMNDRIEFHLGKGPGGFRDPS